MSVDAFPAESPTARAVPRTADSTTPPAHVRGARVVRTVVFVDVVESVRLIEADEEGTIRRWRALVGVVEGTLLPRFGGRLVKSLGDGLLMEFHDVEPAVRCALAIQAECTRRNALGAAPEHLHLRAAAHTTEVITDDRDVYGRGVNLAARLVTIAGPDELVVSAPVCEVVRPLLDVGVEDLGECFLKHLDHPVRAYRIGAAGERPAIVAGLASLADLRPTVAVIPFLARGVASEHAVVGEILADEITTALSRTPEVNVISQLSSGVFRGRPTGADEIRRHLGADYVLTGSYRVVAGRVILNAELNDARSGRVTWSERLQGDVLGVLHGTDDLIDRIVAEAAASVLATELARSQAAALPTLESYTLLMGAVALMHRLSAGSFERARALLETLVERAPRHPVPQAWMAKWHVLRVQQGWAPDVHHEAEQALDRTRRALDVDGDCSLALAMDGFVHTNLLKRLDLADARYRAALAANPNESIAWLLRGTLHAFRGEGSAAMSCTEHALRLSPLDPHRYFYDSLAATAAASAGHHDRAIELARQSLRANRTHTSTWRALAIAQWSSGREDEARESVRELRLLEPHLTVSRWLERSPTSDFAIGREWARALHAAGLPA